MAEVRDYWYIRLPDGRVIRAKSTKSLRYHVRSGRIPATARVRRTASEEWIGLEWTAEFVDLVPRSNGAARSRAKQLSEAAAAARPRLKTLGLRGIAADITGALDSTFRAVKLVPAAALGLFLGVILAIHQGISVEPAWSWGVDAALAAAALFGFCLVAALITQTTFVELSRLRPARSKEIRAGLGRRTAHVFLAGLVSVGVIVGVLVILRRLPAWLSADLGWPDAAVAPVLVARLLWEAACWIVLALLPLAASCVVIEECSFARALRDWWRLARRHLGRLLLLETLAIGLGLLLSAPALVSVFAIDPGFASGPLVLVSRVTLALLGGLALTPLLAYALVANVYIYLNLRYHSPAGRI